MALLRKVVLPVLLITILGLTLTGIINYIVAREAVYSNRMAIGQVVAQELTVGLDLVLTGAQQRLSDLSLSEKVTMLLSGPMAVSEAEKSVLSNRLDSMVTDIDAISSFAIIDVQGKPVVASSPAVAVLDFSERQYFKEALLGRKAQEGPLIGRASGSTVYVLAEPVFSNNKVVGVVMCGISLEYLNQRLIDSIKLENGGYVYVLSASGQMVMHPLRSELFSHNVFSTSEIETMKKEKSGIINYANAAGQPMLASFVSMKYPHWIVVAASDKESSMQEVASIRNSSLLVNGVTLVMVIVLISLIMLRMIGDLRKTVFFAKAITAGDLSHKLKIERNDEIGVLAGALSTMVDTLQGEIDTSEARAKEIERAKAEIEAIVNGVKGGVVKIEFDKEIKMLWANSGFYQLYGCANEAEFREYIATQPNKAVYPDDVSLFQRSEEGLGEDNTLVELVYRIYRKDGSLAWLRARANLVESEGSTNIYQAVIVDVTAEKMAMHNMEQEQERYRILVHMSKDILFEYDIAEDIMTYAGQYEPIFGPQRVVPNFLGKLEQIAHCHSEDAGILRNIFQGEKVHGSSKNFEINISTPLGECLWYRVYFTILLNELGQPSKVIGKFLNIQEQKEKEEELAAEAERDGMTGLFNKKATESKVTNALHKKKDFMHALIIVDVDDFKHANDNFGHMFGDEVLKRVARLLEEAFRSTDIVGRIGGDEFLVFAQDIQSKEKIIARVENLYKAMWSTVVEGNTEYRLSLSVGLCVYEGGEASYDELFKKADEALYNSKKGGKGRFALYEA